MNQCESLATKAELNLLKSEIEQILATKLDTSEKPEIINYTLQQANFYSDQADFSLQSKMLAWVASFVGSAIAAATGVLKALFDKLASAFEQFKNYISNEVIPFYQKLIGDLQKEINVLGDEINKVGNTLNDLYASIANVTNDVAKLKEKIATLEDYVYNVQDKRIQKAQSTAETADSRSLFAQSTAENASLQAKQASIDAAQALAAAKEALKYINGLIEEMNKLKDLYAKVLGELEQVKIAQSILSVQLKQLEYELTQLKIIQSEQSIKIKLLEAEIDQVKIAQSILSVLTQQLQFQVGAIWSAIYDIEQKMAQLKGLIGSGGGLSAGQVQAIAQSEAASATGKLGAKISAEIGSLKGSITGIGAEVASVKEATSFTGAKVSTLSSNLQGQLDSKITNLETKLQTVNSKEGTEIKHSISGIESILQGLQTSIGNISQGDLTAKEIGLIAAIPAISVGIPAILKSVSPAALTSAAASGVCQTTKPGGCLNTKLGNLGNSNLLDKINAGVNAANTAANAAQIAMLNTINTKLGVQINNGGIGGTLGRLYSFLAIDRWLNMINTALLFHNAMMLSRNLGGTAVNAIGSVFNFAGIKFKNAEGEEQELSTVINHNIADFAKHILGAENYTAMNATWKQASSIYTTGANLLTTVHSMMDSAQSLLNLAIENTGRIGNALRRAGAIFEREGQFTEKATAQSKYQKQFNNFNETVEGAENLFSGVENVTGELVSIKDNLKELKEQREAFDKSVKDWNETSKTNSNLEKVISASPQIDTKDLTKPSN